GPDGGTVLHRAPQAKNAPRKRRKRRRGRKVFARDGVLSPVPASPERTAGVNGTPLGEPAGTAAVAKVVDGGDAGAQRREWRAPRRRDEPVYAALDLGTNNCRLLIAIPTRPGQFRVIDAFSRIVRLGEGLAATGRLNDAAMDRAVEALRICADK